MVSSEQEKMALVPTITEEEIGRLQGHISEADFGRIEFLEIVHIEKPRIIYTDGTKHFFFLAGLSVSTKGCSDSDFGSEHLLLPWLSNQRA